MASRERVDTASRMIMASVEAVYAAFADPEAWTQWLPPTGMICEIAEFDFREGGRYRLTLTYTDQTGYGKSSDDTDIVQGTFAELVPNSRMVQLVEFASDDVAFSGTMHMNWSLTPEATGTRVTITAEDVPPGISPEDHATGMNSTLENLARYVENRI